MASSTDQLKHAKFVVQKFGGNFGNLCSNSSSIRAVAEQWRNLQAEFNSVHNSVVRRVEKFDSEERESGVSVSGGEGLLIEIDLSEKFVKFGEKLEEWEKKRKKKIIERCEGLELRDEGLRAESKSVGEGFVAKKMNEGLDCEECVKISDHENVVDCGMEVLEMMKEEELKERREALEAKERDIEDLRRVLEAKEKEVDERCARVGAREKRMCGKSRALGLKDKELNDLSKGVGSKEEESLGAGFRRLESKEKHMEKMRRVVEAKEKEVDECCARVGAREKRLCGKSKALVVKDKGLNDLSKGLGSKEESLGAGFRGLESKDMEDMRRVVGAREKRLCGKSKALVVKDKGLNDLSKGLRSKEESLGAGSRGLELKGAHMEGRGEVLKLKEEKVNEVCRGVELNKKRKDEGLKAMENERGQKKRRCLVRDFSGKETNGVKEKQRSELCKAQVLEENGRRGKDYFDGHCKELDSPKGREVNVLCKQKGLVDRKAYDCMEMRGIGQRKASDRGDQLKSKENQMRCQAIEVKTNHTNKFVSKMELKEEQMGDEGVEMKIKEINEGMSKTDSKVKQTGGEDMALEIKQIGKQKKKRPLIEVTREKKMNKVWKRVVLGEKVVDECGQVMDSKEKKTNKLYETEGIEEKQRGGDCIEDCCDLKEGKEMALNEHSKLETQSNVHVKAEGFDGKQISECENQLEFKGKQMSDESLGFKMNQMNEFARQLESRDKEMSDGSTKMKESKELLSQLESMGEKLSAEALELKQDHLVDHCKERNCDVKKELIDAKSDELGLKEEQLQQCDENLVVGNNNSNEEVLDLNVKLTDHNGELEDGQIGNDCSTEVELNEEANKRSCNVEESIQKPLVKCDTNLADNFGNESGVLKFVATDGKTLQTFLNERVGKHESMGEEINSILRSSENPAGLVLDAVGGFFPRDLNKVDSPYKPSVIRSSCLLLLEQLMVLKPVIRRPLKIEATKVAVEWRAKMRAEGESEVLALGYLLLVATYNLTSLFIWDHLSRLCELVDHHRLTPQLRQSLCIPKRVNVTRKLTEERRKQPGSDNRGGASFEGCSSSGGDIHSLCRNMDAHGVISYLIQHVRGQGIPHDQVRDALRYASDPARLVLDVSRSFHRTDSDEMYNDAKEVSCIVLLGLLVKLSPSITPDVELEARDFAAFWRARLHGELDRPNEENRRSDTLGFLQFIAAYKLMIHYRRRNLFRLFKSSSAIKGYPPEQMVDLCCALGLQDKIPDVIRSLIAEQKQPVAVKYVCIYKLEGDFPPVRLLEAHLAIIRERAARIRTGTMQAKVHAAKMEMACLRDVLDCISSCKLQSIFPPDSLLARINELKEEMAVTTASRSARKRCASTSVSPMPVEQQVKRPRTPRVRLSPNHHVRLQSFGHPTQIMPNVYPLPVRLYPVGSPVPLSRWAGRRR